MRLLRLGLVRAGERKRSTPSCVDSETSLVDEALARRLKKGQARKAIFSMADNVHVDVTVCLIERKLAARSPSVEPTSTRRVGYRRWITLAVMSLARSEQRKTMTSATSSGEAMWINSLLSSIASRTAGVIHPVSVTGG